MNKTNEPLAIWALVLGALSLIGCSLLTAIPAVICGHIGRANIRKNSMLSGAGIALAGLIMGYLSLATIPLIVAAIAIPNIAGITQQAQEAGAKRQAQLIVLVADSVRTAGFKGAWETKEQAISDIEKGITVNNTLFQVPPSSPAALKYITLQGTGENATLQYTSE